MSDTPDTSGATSAAGSGGAVALAVSAALTILGCARGPENDIPIRIEPASAKPLGDARPSTPPPPERLPIPTLMAAMSLSEKAAQLRGTHPGTPDSPNWDDTFRAPDNPGRGIRGFRFRDGPRGVNLNPGCPEEGACHATAFPVSIARGATFDLELEHRIGRAIGDETLASGNTVLLAPCLDVIRHPAWGRAQESYGEDPHHIGRMGAAFIRGVQRYVAACAKHFTAYNVETDARKVDAIVGERALREVYGRPFEIAVEEAAVACIMASYNRVNGTPATKSPPLLRDMLKADIGFRGFVISDWWSMENWGDLTLGASQYRAVARESLLAGLDMEMPWSLNFAHLEALVDAGEVPQARLDDSVRRILEQKHRFNIAHLSEPPGLSPPRTRLTAAQSITGNADHIALAREAAVRSMVLLKNEGDTLPISPEETKTVAVLGLRVPFEPWRWAKNPKRHVDFLHDVPLGDMGSSRVDADPSKSTALRQGIAQAAGPGVRIVTGRSAAAAKGADIAVVIAGLTPGDEGEGYTDAGDRPSLRLDAKLPGTPQDDLIQSVAALGIPMVVVLVGGSAIEMPWLADVPAVVMSWYPGMQGGRALGDLLFGHRNFSGRLPLTWPATWEALPQLGPDEQGKVRMDDHVGYRYYAKNAVEPLYPFGHGLSYTAFRLENLQVAAPPNPGTEALTVYVDVTNTGSAYGEETLFVFASHTQGESRRTVRALKGFDKIALRPGRTRTAAIPVTAASLNRWNEETGSWDPPQGTITIEVGNTAAPPFLSRAVPVR